MMSGQASSYEPRLRSATGADLQSLVGLLEAAALPTAGIPPGLGDFFVAEDRGRIVGAIGLELYGQAGLLRSAVVDAAARGTGIGGVLVCRVLHHARERGITEVFLLTTTAERYFPRFGFTPVAREEVPGAVRTSVEFREACPASAVVMRNRLSR